MNDDERIDDDTMKNEETMNIYGKFVVNS